MEVAAGTNGTWEDVFNGDDESGAGWKASAASDPAVLNLTGRKVEGTTVTLRYGCKNNHSGVKINGRDVALVGNNTRQNIDVDVSAEGGFETFEIVPGGNDSGDTLSIFSLRVDSNVLLQGGTDVSVISTGYPDSNTMVVDGGTWDTSNQSQVWSDNGNWLSRHWRHQTEALMLIYLTGGRFTGKTGDLGTNAVGTDDLFGSNNVPRHLDWIGL